MQSGTLSAGPPLTRESHVTLDGFAEAVSAADGVHLAELLPIEQVEVRTRNTRYVITVVAPSDSRVIVHGGAFFPVPSEARIAGATLGGSMLKLGWIGRGFCLEFHHDGKRIVTTRVRDIRRHGHSSLPGPF